MDIDFIQEVYREDIFKLMELCNIEMAQAYELYICHGNSVEAVMQAKFNDSPIKNNSEHQIKNQNNKFEQSVDHHYDEYQKYKIFITGNMKYLDKYPIHPKENILKKMMPSILKSNQIDVFKKKVQKYIGHRCNIQYGQGNLSEILYTIWKKQKFPLIVHLFNFDNNFMKYIKEILLDPRFIEKFNVQFRNYGIDVDSYQLEPQLKQVIDLKTDINCFIVLRVDIFDEVKIINKIKIGDLNLRDLLKQFKEIKSKIINIELQQRYLEVRWNKQLQGIEYNKPLSIKQQKKVIEDKNIRKKQQQQYFESLAKQNTKMQIENNQKQKINSQQNKKQQIFEQRKMIHKKLKIYNQGIQLKLRLPSGESIKIFVNQNQQISYLFHFIFSYEQQNIGFQAQPNRIFDILRPYDQLSLKDKKNQTFKNVFENSDMESLIIKEEQTQNQQ